MSPINKNPAYDALADAAEDLKRFSPWEDDFAPFVLLSDNQPPVMVVFEEGDDNERDIRFILDQDGLRSFCFEEDLDFDQPSATAIVNAYEGHYYNIGYSSKDMTAFERNLSIGRKEPLRFYVQKPSHSPETLTNQSDYEALLSHAKHLLRLFSRQILRAQDTQDAFNLATNTGGKVVSAACYRLSGEGAERIDDYTLRYQDFLRLAPACTDEFSNARVGHLRPTADEYELFRLYLPAKLAGSSKLAQVIFLVNLESGYIEYNDLIPVGNNWAEDIVRSLWKNFLDEGKRPLTLYISSLPLYTAIGESLRRAKINPQFLQPSFVAEEIIDTYLGAMSLDRYDLLKGTMVHNPF